MAGGGGGPQSRSLSPPPAPRLSSSPRSAQVTSQDGPRRLQPRAPADPREATGHEDSDADPCVPSEKQVTQGQSPPATGPKAAAQSDLPPCLPDPGKAREGPTGVTGVQLTFKQPRRPHPGQAPTTDPTAPSGGLTHQGVRPRKSGPTHPPSADPRSRSVRQAI